MRSVKHLGAGLLLATALVAAPALAQHEGVPEGEVAAEGEGHAAHPSELDHLQIHGIGDLFAIPADLPPEIKEEREHLRAQLLAAFVNFGLLIFILVKKALPGVREGLVERRNALAKDLEEASRLKREAEEKHKEYQRRLEKLDDELTSIRTEMERTAKAEGERIVAEAQAKAERSRRETEFLIEQRMKALRTELTRETVVAAVDAAEKLLREKTSADDQQRLSKAYVAGIAQAGKEGRA